MFESTPTFFPSFFCPKDDAILHYFFHRPLTMPGRDVPAKPSERVWAGRELHPRVTGMVVPSSNQTWLAGKWTIDHWFSLSNIHLIRGFSSQPCLITGGYSMMLLTNYPQTSLFQGGELLSYTQICSFAINGRNETKSSTGQAETVG